MRDNQAEKQGNGKEGRESYKGGTLRRVIVCGGKGRGVLLEFLLEERMTEKPHGA